MRCFGKLQNLNSKSEGQSPVIVCRRYKAIGMGIQQRGRSIALLCPLVRENKYPTCASILRTMSSCDYLKMVGMTSDSMRILCQPWTGITIFQGLIRGEIDRWASSWRGILDTIDNLVAFEVKSLSKLCVLCSKLDPAKSSGAVKVQP